MACCFLVLSLAVSGCGGGYPGGTLTLSASAITLDSGQTVTIASNFPASQPLAWGFTGKTCTGSACGTLSSATGTSINYTAPSVTSQSSATLVATVSGTASTQTVAITINPAPTLTGTPPAGTVGTPYTTTIKASGGTGPLKVSLASGSLPAGLSFNASTGVISGTPTAVGTSTFVVQATDASSVPYTVSATESITITTTQGTPLALKGTIPAGTVGVAYNGALQASGGTAPYAYALTSGSLPPGLVLNGATGAITGIPTAQGVATFTGQAVDASGTVVTASFSLTTSAATTPITLTSGTLPNGTVGTPYSSTVGVTGGTAPYACSLASGTLPAGLALGANCLVSGTPTTVGTTTVTVKATDASNPQQSTTGPETITINPAGITLTSGTLPNGTVGTPYSSTVGVTGGTAPYACTLTSGTLPAGLTLGANCLVSGTPTTVGTTTVMVKATDAGNQQQSTTGPETITINPAGITLTSGTLPNGTVGTPYSSTVGVTGGTSPYACTLTSGTLPAGLTLGANCLVSGTPTTAGTTTVMVKATDAGNPQQSTTGPETITISPASVTLTTSTLPNGMVGTPYSSTIGVSGGTSPYACTLTSGTLPAGLTLGANCLVSGTPTTAGTTTVMVKATDSGNPQQSTTGPETITISPASVTLTTSTLPNGTVGTPYSSTIGVSGGTSPYACTLTSGTLPAGLTLGANCLVSGTPTTVGTTTVTVKATDGGNPQQSTNSPETITISPAGITLTSGTLPNGTVGTPYSSTIGVSGGTAPYACTLTSGTLPAGLALGANCLVSGTPTTAGTTTVMVKATDAGNPQQSITGPETITINPAAIALTSGTLPNGTVGTPYSSTIGVSGGTAPYACTLTSGTLPAGLTLGANCLVSGTPTTAGTTTVMVKATDAGNPQQSITGPETITINPAAISLTSGTLPNGTVGTPYSSTIGVTGGTAPYACTLTSGTLPAGLTLGANCLVSGTPTAAGTTTVMVKATDAGNPQQSITGPETITINPAAISLTSGTLPNGTVGTPYSSTIGVSGGTSPYACTLTSGTLPAGLTLGANCLVSGTPTTAGTTTVMVNATDAGNPQQSITGPETITINPAALSLTTGTLPNGTVGTPYSSTIGVTGGTAPYACTLTSGTLPAGLALGPNCLVSGTPTTAGTTTVMVKATDAGNPQQSITGPETITINPAAISLTSGTLPNGTVGTPYSSTIGVSGGTSPYACTLTSGTLPAGLALGANCLVSGTPTTAGTTTVMVKATDAGNPQQSITGPETITINPAPTLTVTGPPNGTVGTPYTGGIGVTGGTGPYNCALASGTVPAGLTLNANCQFTGTPTTPGTTTVTVTTTDSSSPVTTKTSTVPITINPATTTLTLSNPPTATVATPYTGSIGVSGGTAPYSCTIQSGALPTGLTLTPNSCALSGTPTTAGSTSPVVTATDSANPTNTITGPVTVTVQPVPTLTFTGSLPNGTVGSPYTQTLSASGGVGPYTYAVTVGTLPAGLTLSTAGVVSGTPTTPGAKSFTVTATDSEGTPQTASLPLLLLITQPTTPTDAELTGPYAFLFQGYDDVAIGVLAYQTATVGSFTADGTGVITGGELDTNHQSSTPTGNTVPTNNLLGTYTLGTDGRGTLTLSALNTDGTVARTTTYAIAVKAPIAPATTAVQGSLIEFDGNQTAGTKGSGLFLAQTATSFATGLTGSYAFGAQGDTPCLPACTVGVVAGPVAAVGQFNTDNAGTVTGGTGDENIASTKLANAALSGSYGAADSNGRVQLTLSTSNTVTGVYPTDYAVYMVNATQAFLMSTDKHSTYILLAGSATSQQTPAAFSTAASLTGPFVGYENAPTNPGLAGVALQNVLNLSTATIFQGTVATSGTCHINYVDQGGTTALANGLTGLGSGTPILNALLGTYAQTGDGGCSVAPNGRAVINYPAPAGLLPGVLTLLGLPDVPPPARVAYLSSPNTGYFLETGYAGLGRLEQQVGLPSTLATLNGNFVYGTTPASSLASLDGAGIFTADGAGNATSTVDENVGVGTLNVLQLGTTNNQTYTLYDGNAGRFLLGGSNTVIYAISPGRFVLLDKSALTTSPAVALLF